MSDRLLLVDDDQLIHASVAALLSGTEISHTAVWDVPSALEVLRRAPDAFGLILLDYHLPGTPSELAVREIRAAAPHAFVLIFSGDPSREVVKSSLRLGVSDFIEKSAETEGILTTLRDFFNRARERRGPGLTPDLRRRSEKIAEAGLVGASAAMERVANLVLQNREHRFTVLILGESGTGKERVARAIHGNNPAPLLAVNCAAYRESAQLLEAELFGSEKGSFTGADRSRPGLLESASGGTVLLDEVHELSISAQAKLLRAVQERKIRRVGGVVEIPFDARIIAAAKPVLVQKTESGEFLIDLYNRLCVFPIEIPSLRERPEDVSVLVDHFLSRYSSELGKTVSVSPALRAEMATYPWPGNVRELENLVLRLIVSHPEGSVVENLELGASPVNRRVQKPGYLSHLKDAFEDNERRSIREALEKSGSNLRAAARLLGVSHTTLFGKVKRYKLDSRTG